jgi:hypothetical protein
MERYGFWNREKERSPGRRIKVNFLRETKEKNLERRRKDLTKYNNKNPRTITGMTHSTYV